MKAIIILLLLGVLPLLFTTLKNSYNIKVGKTMPWNNKTKTSLLRLIKLQSINALITLALVLITGELLNLEFGTDIDLLPLPVTLFYVILIIVMLWSLFMFYKYVHLFFKIKKLTV